MNHDLYFDSVDVKINDSIVGCDKYLYKTLGAKTYNIKFPVNVQVQLFANGSEFKELPFEMSKNTVLKFYAKEYCRFLNDMGQAEKDKLVDYQLLNDEGYCWIVEKIDEDGAGRCVTQGGRGTFCDYI